MFATGLDWQTPAAVAPGGGRLAFSQVDASGVTNVWTIDASGEKRQITREPTFAAYPTWSPDGRTLAVEFRNEGVGLHMGYVDAEGGKVTPLTSGEEECFSGGWSPDGDKIVFPRRPLDSPMEKWDIWWVSRSTGEMKRLTERPVHPGREFVRYPTWSARGDRIFFELAQSTADLWLLELPASP
jgi:Tol biopolymer transport system component